jgi:hypothetical protein
MLELTIRGLSAPFDTHELERLTLRHHTEAFANELLAGCGKMDDVT